MISRLLLVFFVFFALPATRLTNKDSYALPPASVQSKNYLLLTLIQQNDKVRQLLENDPQLTALNEQINNRIAKSVKECGYFSCITLSLKLTDNEIKRAGGRLADLFKPGNALGLMVNKQLIPSGAYVKYKTLTPVQQLVKAWEQDAAGINYVINIYADGQKPRTPDIDSISFDVHNPHYIATIKENVKQAAEAADNKLFFCIPLMSSLEFITKNGRDDAISFEPMETTVNSEALKKLKSINWSKYKYTVLLVPGAGPNTYGQVISNAGIYRCKLALADYNKGMAPFIMVSGGRVHPYKTKYFEAEEMKNYLIKALHVPENAIIMEPHARHTTTNIRNGVRLLLKYHFPVNKPGLIVTDQVQSIFLPVMALRCKNELGIVPYKLGKRLNSTQREFYATPNALQINPIDPIDP